MVLEEPALLQDYRNLSRSKTQLSLWMDVDETVRSPSGRKEKEVWAGGGGGGWPRAGKPVEQMPNAEQEEVLVTASVSRHKASRVDQW